MNETTELTDAERTRGVVTTKRAGEILGVSAHQVVYEIRLGRLAATRTTLAPRSRLLVEIAGPIGLEAYIATRAARVPPPPLTPS